MIQFSTVYGLPFCGPSIIDHYMCGMYPLLKLVPTDTYVSDVLAAFSGGLICTLGFLLLLWSHPALSEEPESGKRRKALQTCGSHITVVVCFFVPCIFMYVRPWM